MSAPLRTSIGLRVRTGRDEVDVAVDLVDPEVTMSEVFRALGMAAGTVDGRFVDAADTVEAHRVLVPGSVLEPAEATAGRGATRGAATPPGRADGFDAEPIRSGATDCAKSPVGPEAGDVEEAEEAEDVEGAEGADGAKEVEDVDEVGEVEVAVVAGLDAGHRCAVPGGVYRLQVTHGSGSTDWLLDLGFGRPAGDAESAPWHERGASVEVLDVPARGAVAVSRTIDVEVSPIRTVQRPPRQMAPEFVPPIVPPPSPEPVRPPAPLSWATLLAPAPVAIMMAIFFRPIFALFAAMGPIMALGRWYEERRRFRRERRRRAAALAALSAEVASALRAQAESVAALRWLRQPHIAELRRRASAGSVRLWERRFGAPGFLVASVGVGPDAVAPLVETRARLDDEIHGPLRVPLAIRSVPHVVDLSGVTGIGFHGDRDATLSVVRSVVLQLATLHGPVDLSLGVLCPADAADDWDWTKWLPQLDRTLVAHDVDRLGSEWRRHGPPSGGPAPTRVVVVDDPRADVARLLHEARRGNVELRVVCVGADPTSLPAACEVLVSVADGRAEIVQPGGGDRSDAGVPIGVSKRTAQDWARSLGRHTDPEAPDRVLADASTVGLRSLIEVHDPEELAERWRRRTPDEPPVVVVGVTGGGPAVIDLVADGPHVLVAGTTGSGKSELLRTLVATLAVVCPPDHLNFVLVDFKGGGAFDAVSRLPHVAGLITDLDETMIGRALNSLRAELVRREELVRTLGSSTFEDATLVAGEPLARLVVVIDEFAALATDHPDLLAGIVDLAARGRSLGMHLVLATQRPSGVVDQKIRANTDLKIALRVQDAFDSQDVVGVADAATIDRRRPGRAYVRIASEPPVLVQTAFGGGPDDRQERCSVRPLRLFDPVDDQADEGRRPAAEIDPPDGSLPQPARPRQLDVVVECVLEAAGRGWSQATRMWNDPLPAPLEWADLAAASPGEHAPDADAGSAVELGLLDRPELRRHEPWRWDPSSGALCIFGASADDAAKALLALGVALLRRSPAETHIYVIDGGGGGLRALAESPGTGAYLGLHDLDRVERTVALLERAIARRRNGNTAEPRLVLLVDNIAAVLDQHDDLAEADLVDRLNAVVRDGSTRGVHIAITARSVRDVPHRLAQQIPNRLVQALADPGGYLALGLRAREVPPLPPMRAVDVATSRVVQLVEPPAELDLVQTSTHDSVEPCVERVPGFPSSLSVADLPPARLVDGVVHLPIGVEGRGLGFGELELRPSRHMLVVGAPGSGRTTTLGTIVDRLDAAGIDAMTVTADTEPSAIDRLEGRATPIVMLIDDADGLRPETATACERLLADPGAIVVAATTPSAARSLRSWFAPIRAGGVGLLLGTCAGEPDLLGARGERVPGLGEVPGRGRLTTAGRSVAIQVASPTAATDEVWLL